MDFLLSPLRIDELQTIIERAVEKAVAGIPQQAPKIDPENELLDAEHAAEFLGVALPTLYGLVSGNKITSMKPGGRLYFSKADLIDYIKTAKRYSKSALDRGLDREFTRTKTAA